MMSGCSVRISTATRAVKQPCCAMDSGSSCTLCKFANNNKLCGAVNSPGRKGYHPEGPDRLRGENLMKINPHHSVVL